MIECNDNENGNENKVVHKHKYDNGTWGFIFFLSFIGAAVYFIQQADSFGAGVLGFLKAIVWPALLIYKVFTMIGM